ncbi:MAG: hybrid sensor histidine kinase/response regulator [Planctomycetes bacterium]|nr:hybrid sensor histidine kinase/response regulator [Planctomycetota bacterium]
METATKTDTATGALSVLLVEDNDVDAMSLERLLERALPISPTIARARELQEGIALLNDGSFDVIFLDVCLPDGDRQATFDWLQANAPNVPVIVLTGLPDDAAATDALRQGAQDFLVKDRVDATTVARSLRFALERHRLQHELVTARTRESELKDRLLSHVSHELRTPLTAIMQFAAILRDGIAGEVNAKQCEFLEIITRNATQLKAMIGTLMDVSRISTDKLRCDLGVGKLQPVIAGILSSLAPRAAENGLQLSLEPGDPLPAAVFDPSRIEEVVTNLLENAFKFTPPGGAVTVATSLHEDNGARLRITVRDTGIGIPSEQLEAVFDRLTQIGQGSDTSRRGLGLGLYLCREIVHQHGGRIWATRNPDLGTSFHFELPAYRLRDYLEHALGRSDIATTDVCLMQIVVRAEQPAAIAKGARSVHRQVVETVERCIVKQSDVVLPGRRPTGAQLAVHCLIRSGPDGAAAVERRLRQEFEEQGRLQPRGFSIEVKGHQASEADGPRGSRSLATVTAHFEKIIESTRAAT